MGEVKHLQINYKTDELFADFREFGNKNLYMIEELKGQMIDASSDSPFYGIFVGNKLVARMALLDKGEVEETYLNFAKENKKPIKAIARNNSKEFFLKQGFKDVETKNPEGHDILIWNP